MGLIRFADTLFSAECAKGVQMRGQKHGTFSKEFREEAIRQAREERRPLTAWARDLGVKYSTLRLWVKQAEDADSERPGRARDLVAANQRLRAENHQLRLEREILKTATAFFATHSK
jgi:transposase